MTEETKKTTRKTATRKTTTTRRGRKPKTSQPKPVDVNLDSKLPDNLEDDATSAIADEACKDGDNITVGAKAFDTSGVTVTGPTSENFSEKGNLFDLKVSLDKPMLVNNNRPFVEVSTGLDVKLGDGLIGVLFPHPDLVNGNMTLKGSPVVITGDNPSLSIVVQNVGIGKTQLSDGDNIATMLVLPAYHVDVKTSD